MITLRFDNTLHYGEHEIDVTEFPRGIPYDIALNDNAIRLIPWMDATTRRVAVNHLPGGWFTADGWLLIGVYCRNPYECSWFEHMYFTMPFARTQIGAMEEPLPGYKSLFSDRWTTMTFLRRQCGSFCSQQDSLFYWRDCDSQSHTAR